MNTNNKQPKASKNHELLKTIFPDYEKSYLSDKYYDQKKYDIKEKHQMFYD